LKYKPTKNKDAPDGRQRYYKSYRIRKLIPKQIYGHYRIRKENLKRKLRQSSVYTFVARQFYEQNLIRK